VSRVEIFLDGRMAGQAGLDRPRPDIAPLLGDSTAELAGFEFLVDLRRLQHLRDVVRLDARVSLLDGATADLRPVRIRLRRVTPPASGESIATARPLRLLGSADPIRLLCSARSLDRGGSQLRMRELIEHLREGGRVDVTVMSPTEGPLRHDLEALGAQIVLAPVPIGDVGAYEETLASMATWAEGRFDVVLGATLSSFPAIDLADRLGLPALWRIGEAEPLETVVKWLGGTLDPAVEVNVRRAFRTASLVYFNSQAGLRLYRHNGMDGRFVVLASGTDVVGAGRFVADSNRDAMRAHLGVGLESRLLVCVATVWPIKGQAALVKALKHVLIDHPELECVLIGMHIEPYAQAVQRFIERLNLTPWIRVQPFCEDLRPWWRAADAAVCPSESESMPAAVVEAMSFGLPVLACRVGGIPEIVKDGHTGWLCERNDLGSLIAGLRRVAAAPAEDLRAAGERAASYVQAEHDRRSALSRLTELIESSARRSYRTGSEPESPVCHARGHVRSACGQSRALRS
jgi:glycosyltransferase involved in cell wall biosynthesis